jgi:DNA-binding CsgD family transcriptional regulator
LAAPGIAQVMAELGAQGALDQRLLERHRGRIDRLAAHRAADELVNEFLGMVGSAADCRDAAFFIFVLLGIHAPWVMLCLTHKILTGSALRALHAGASGYLTKESDGEVLVAVIRKVAGGGIHVSEKVAAMLARERMPLIDELPHTRLSDREFQIFEKIIGGSRLTDIANELNLSIKTVSTHKSRILQKMSMASETDLVRYAIAKGLLNPAE